MEQDIKDGESRIIYLEPNDAMDDINGVPMTPDYPDLCIAFNLIVEVVPRFKTTAEKGKDYSGKYCIYWRSKSPLNGESYKPGTYVSFLTGKDGFLTTYYTDTNYEDVVRENIVEGLGVENVTVAFENYYTPTVTIKFVDQRGSSLFGREEATHHDDKLTIDNIFGAFFTAPYPKFKLQIKGFYGQAVTLQLTCSGFKGSLNSQTGNFEATATFIGYSYSLLTDIPFQYIVAAPYCNYAGHEYWEQNKNSSDWMLYGGQPMMTLYELMERINQAFSKTELLKIVSDSEEEVIRSGETEKGQIVNVIGAFNSFKNILQMSTNNWLSNYTGAGIDDEQLLLFTDSDRISMTTDITTAWESLSNAVKKYNEDYPSNEIPKSSMPNEIPVDGKLLEMVTIDIFNVEVGENNGPTVVTFSDGSGNVYSKTELASLKFNVNTYGNPRALSESMVERLYNSLTPGSVVEKIKTHAYLFDFHDFVKRLNERSKFIDDEAREIEQNAERNYVQLAKDNLGIVPYIGNIFKMIMAHIETFVFMMYTVFNRIEQQANVGQRTPSHLNIAGNGTLADISTNGEIENVPAWPLVTRANSENNAFVEQENENTIGWVGDFSPYFEEEKLVRELFLACKKTVGDNFSNREQETNVSYIPITPCDVNMIENVFSGNPEASMSSLAGMLGIRTAQLFGIMEKSAVDNSVATVMGRMDAYNYYLHNPSKSEIKEKIVDATGNKSLADKLYDIMLCNPDEDSSGDTFQGKETIQRHKFEKVRGVIGAKKERHPIYAENGSNLKYVHFYTNNNHALVPSVVITFDLYSNRYRYNNSDGNPYFAYEYYNDTIPDTLINCNSNSISDDNDKFDKKNYVNLEMFNVELNPSKVEGILKRYDELKTNSFKIIGEQFSDNFSKVFDRYWKVDDSSYKSFVRNFACMLTKKYEDMGIDMATMSSMNRDEVYKNKVTYSGDGQWGDGYSLDSVFVPFVDIYTVDKTSCGLFGSYLYYIQNTIEDKEVRDRAKALLILHCTTLPYNTPSLNFSSGSKMCGTVQIATVGYMLLLGGLLWREKYFDENGSDPIKYAYEEKDKSVRFTYKPAGREFSLYFKSGDTVLPSAIYSGDATNSYNVKTSTLMGGVNLDYHIKNCLINKFEEFVKGECQTLFNSLEIRGKGQTRAQNLNPTAIYKLFNKIKVGERNQAIWNTRKSIANNALSNFFDSYVYYGARELVNTPFALYLSDKNTSVQNLLKRLYCGKAIIMDTSAQRFTANGAKTRAEGTNTDVSVSSQNVRAYLEGFASALSKIVESVGETVISNDNKSDTEHGDIAEFDRDVAVPIYMYLKSLWDKWLVASDKTDPYNSEYSVHNFFNNFVFIDSFYRNIANRFMINCQILLDRYNQNNNSTKDYSVFKYIGDVTSDHHCMFLAVPDFIDDMSNEAKEKARLALNSIFKPIPYAEMRDMTLNNKFVIIYIPKLSETPSEINNYADDSFNIWSYSERDGVAPKILKLSGSTDEGLSSYGYYVPSFGLAYGRQHNHLFKNLNLNMETPIITSAVINTLSHIAKQGAANSHAIAFVGQDIYPVFSNYSYICEFEMMGCAQIQPLMYFQLMNVPMWRGTYMIFNVTHTMTPGNMVTRVRAMKLSNRAVPYSNAWFKKNLNYEPDASTNDADCNDAGYDGSANANGSADGNEQSNISQSEIDKRLASLFNGNAPSRTYHSKPDGFDNWMTNVTFNNNGKSYTITVHKALAEKFKSALEELDKVGFKVLFTPHSYKWRKVSGTNRLSRHSFGCAIDINGTTSEGVNSKLNPWVKRGKPLSSGDSDTAIRTWNSPVVKIMNKYGFGWGGKYGDYMHFSYLGGS